MKRLFGNVTRLVGEETEEAQGAERESETKAVFISAFGRQQL